MPVQSVPRNSKKSFTRSWRQESSKPCLKPVVVKLSYCDICKYVGRYRRCELSLQSIMRSANSGCPTCVIISQIATIFSSPDVLRADDGVAHITLSYPLVLEFQSFRSSDPSKNSPVQRIEVFHTDVSNSYTLKFLGIDMWNGTPVCENSLSDPLAWTTVVPWLDECIHNHPRCISSLSQLPTRVLDLGQDPSPTGDIKLYESLNNHTASYVCLSHCWGPDGCSFKTTSGNLRSRKDNITFTDLPKTFQDAVQFARWLEVRYLWIDALCIIQDDADDWDREAGLMAAIYANAYVTLAAVSSSSGSGGLLSDLNRETWQLKLPGQALAQDQIEVLFRKAISHPVMLQEFVGDSLDYPLLQRAWVFQERLLSPRIIYFGKQEMYWDCQESQKCECRNYRPEVHGSWTRSHLNEILTLSNSPRTKSVVLNQWWTWHEIVRYYSRLDITFPTDRISALSGLIKKMQQTPAFSPPSKYCAGVWLDDPGALLWHVTLEPQGPRIDHIAPSWSWASVNQGISHVGLGGNTFIQYTIVDLRCKMIGQDPTGRVQSAELEIEASIVPVVYQTEINEWTLRDASDPIFAEQLVTLAKWDTQLNYESRSDLWLSYLAEAVLPGVYRHWFAIVQRVKGSSSTNGPGIYRRLGMLLYEIDSESPKFGARAKKLFEKRSTIILI